MISIIVRKPYLKHVNKHQLITTAELALNYLRCGDPVDLAILICSNEEISRINFNYRNIYQATDVLSFESFEVNPDSGSYHLGDIVISYDFVIEHSHRFSHDASVELFVLLIHGILHLCGFDHASENDKKEMWTKQYEIHRLLNISVEHLPGENE
jgi:probable rRNA maturation factor